MIFTHDSKSSLNIILSFERVIEADLNLLLSDLLWLLKSIVHISTIIFEESKWLSGKLGENFSSVWDSLLTIEIPNSELVVVDDTILIYIKSVISFY